MLTSPAHVSAHLIHDVDHDDPSDVPCQVDVIAVGTTYDRRPNDGFGRQMVRCHKAIVRCVDTGKVARVAAVSVRSI